MHEPRWIRVCSAADVPPNGGTAVRIDGRQIAVYHFARLNRWFATDNRCPHWGEDVLARGLLGEAAGEPKVVCPMHKRAFSLETGACLAGDVGAVDVYPVEVRDGDVYLYYDAARAAA